MILGAAWNERVKDRRPYEGMIPVALWFRACGSNIFCLVLLIYFNPWTARLLRDVSRDRERALSFGGNGRKAFQASLQSRAWRICTVLIGVQSRRSGPFSADERSSSTISVARLARLEEMFIRLLRNWSWCDLGATCRLQSLGKC